jgi:putative flippase GtrA
MGRRVPSILPAVLGTVIIMAFVAAVGRPNVFTDTRDYMIHGARFYQALRRTFLHEQPPLPKTPAEEKVWQRQKWLTHFNHSNMGARSPYYGILLYTTAHRGTLWTLTFVQALCCAWLLFLLWRAITPAAPGWTYYALMAALSLGASLPWFASFAVPDIFAAVTAMAVALLLVWRSELGRWERLGVWALLTASIAFHSSHLLLTLCLLATGLVLGWAMKAGARTLRTYAALLLGAVAVAAAANAVYAGAIHAHTGDKLRRPPFLMARVLADGPGRAYLRKSCAEGMKWAICPFAKTPLNDSDKILWSAKKVDGVFNRSTYERRVAMEEQEFAFVWETIKSDPWGQFTASMRNWGLQLIRTWVDDPLRRPGAFLRHSYWGKTNLVGLIRGVGPCGAKGELCQPKITITELDAVDSPILLISLAGLAAALLPRRGLVGLLRRREFRWSSPEAKAVAAILMLGAAVVLNAGVCGVFSGPFPRYQARIVWLVPAMSLLMAMALVPAAAWDRFRLRLPAAWTGAAQGALGRLDPAFLRYGVVGATGFTVDAIILHLMVNLIGLNYLAGRLVSFSIAVGVTWLLNRVWTFKTAGASGKLREAAVYVGVQVAGGVANIGVYTLAIVLVPELKDWLIVPLGLGSAAGLCLTFLGAKHLAFRSRQDLPAAAPESAV